MPHISFDSTPFPPEAEAMLKRVRASVAEERAAGLFDADRTS